MGVNSNFKWTDDEDRSLLELKAAGKSNRAIADALKRSASAIEQRVYILRDRDHQSEGN
jgi:DNA-binding NarL/FixJ family response regulator